MQINNSINTNSNMLYHNEKKTKSLNSSFDLKTTHSSNETVNEEKKTGTADIQELYKANASNNKKELGLVSLSKSSLLYFFLYFLALLLPMISIWSRSPFKISFVRLSFNPNNSQKSQMLYSFPSSINSRILSYCICVFLVTFLSPLFIAAFYRRFFIAAFFERKRQHRSIRFKSFFNNRFFPLLILHHPIFIFHPPIILRQTIIFKHFQHSFKTFRKNIIFQLVFFYPEYLPFFG